MNTKRNYYLKFFTNLLGIVLVFSSINLKSQESGFGIKGGMNLSYLNVDNTDDNKLLPGFNAGVWGKYMISENFAIQPEALFTTKGVESTYSAEFLGFDVVEGTTKFRLSYIEIPMNVVYHLTEIFDIHLGPYFGVLMNANVKTQNEVLEFIEIDDEEEIDRNEFNKVDYGITGGVGFSFEPLMFGVNYSLGLAKIAHEDKLSNDLLGDAKNQVLQLYLGLIF